MRVEWTDSAIRSALNLRLYIAQDSQRYADRFINRIFDAVEKLEHFPRSGRRVPEADDESIRELILQNYRIIYRIATDTDPDRSEGTLKPPKARE